jgi:hypothetical protein
MSGMARKSMALAALFAAPSSTLTTDCQRREDLIHGSRVVTRGNGATELTTVTCQMASRSDLALPTSSNTFSTIDAMSGDDSMSSTMNMVDVALPHLYRDPGAKSYNKDNRLTFTLISGSDMALIIMSAFRIQCIAAMS